MGSFRFLVLPKHAMMFNARRSGEILSSSSSCLLSFLLFSALNVINVNDVVSLMSSSGSAPVPTLMSLLQTTAVAVISDISELLNADKLSFSPAQLQRDYFPFMNSKVKKEHISMTSWTGLMSSLNLCAGVIYIRMMEYRKGS